LVSSGLITSSEHWLEFFLVIRATVAMVLLARASAAHGADFLTAEFAGHGGRWGKKKYIFSRVEEERKRCFIASFPLMCPMS